MDPDTLTALHGSIKKWEAIVAGTGSDQGPNNCPLCQLFFGKGCYGCPVREVSHRQGCSDTPYEAWADSNYDRYPTLRDVPLDEYDDALALAQAELDFLRSLLPEGE